MNPIGIFSKIFPRATVDAVLDAVVAHGISSIQFNFSSAGLPTLPPAISAEDVERIRDAVRAHGISIAAISGTFNLIDPDLARRCENLRRLGLLAGAARSLGARVVTLSSGTRDPDDMWRAHPENDSPAAWTEMVDSIRGALAATGRSGITLAVEPEPGNVVSSARRARKLLDEVRSPRLGILLDPANLLASRPHDDQAAVLGEAFHLLGRDIVLAHGKEPIPPGRLDWDLYFRLLAASPYRGPVVLHGFAEEHAKEAIRVAMLAAACRGPQALRT